ncbi:MAG: SGNH/GDSL hydrolase family protein [Opitutaceae bacterium]|nr:SGNH/GDSL hydrolase family protein [Opitutaceae bacterium]
MAFTSAGLRGVVLAAGLCVAGCVSEPGARLARQTGESVVFIGDEPARLAYPPSRDEPVRVRSTYAPGPEVLTYEEGRDYRVDYAAGTLTRLPGSRLPDFRTNVLHGQEQFDHTKFPGYGNKPFFAYVDYRLATGVRWPVQPPQLERLRATQRKLAAGDAVTIVAFGDSITNGGEASTPALIFWQRWVTDLQGKYPRARINAINGATGGDTTTRGLQRLQAKVIDAKPDLVLIGFGMNDHNRRGVPLPEFERQLREMVARLRAATSAEIVLFSTFPPNPRWMHGTNRMADYAEVTARVAAGTGCAYADVFNNWQAMAARKRPEDLLANNINHPNDFGHWIYYRVLAALEL